MSNSKQSGKDGKSETMLERLQRLSEKTGIPLVGPDDPIYNEPATVFFRSKPRRPDSGSEPSSEEQAEPVKPRSTIEEINAFISADMRLGICEQVLQTRDDLVQFAIEKGLAWAMEGYLKRRGWLDSDWQERLDKLGLLGQDYCN